MLTSAALFTFCCKDIIVTGLLSDKSPTYQLKETGDPISDWQQKVSTWIGSEHGRWLQSAVSQPEGRQS
jgi:hypothetical protein